MFDWIFGTSMVWVLLCCGENAVPIAKYKDQGDCVTNQMRINTDSRRARGDHKSIDDSVVFSSCIQAEKLISR